MKPITFLSLLLMLQLTFLSQIKAQDTITNNNDKIRSQMEQGLFDAPQQKLSYERSLWGLKITRGKQLLSNRTVGNMLQAVPSVARDFKAGHTTLIVGDALTVVGAFGLGYGLFATVGSYKDIYGFNKDDRTMGYIMVGSGAALTTAGILMFFSGQKRMRLAIDAYNNSGFISAFTLSPNGVGFVAEF